MKQHIPTFSELVRASCIRNGLNLEQLSARTGISTRTLTRHLSDGKWDREQMRQMHRFLHFTPEEMVTYLEGGK